MAYVNKEVMVKARAALKELNKQYNVKATLSGSNTSTLTLNIAEGAIDFLQNYSNKIKHSKSIDDAENVIAYVKQSGSISINHYYIDRAFTANALEYLEKAKAIMYADHWDKSDIQSDYFNCAFYVNMRVGKWNKPYRLVW